MPPTARESSWPGSAKRSPSRSAIGLAPIATMSRRIPPTPVAAPWNGSTADGWLWLSTLNATARPSPRSSTPAFSPGPWRTRSPELGSRFRRSAECLYPQCSDQRSEKTASSKSFGFRPSRAWMRSCSPSVRPRARWSGCCATLLREVSLTGWPDRASRIGRPRSGHLLDTIPTRPRGTPVSLKSRYRGRRHAWETPLSELRANPDRRVRCDYRRSTRTTRVASNGDALLAAALPPGRDLGRVVPLHQGGARGRRAGADDGDPRPRSRDHALRLPRSHPRPPALHRRARSELAPRARPRRPQRDHPLLAHRMGREAHRLERRRDRAVDRPDLHLPPCHAIPPARAGRRSAHRGSRARVRRCHRPCRPRPAWRLAGRGGDARGRA